MKPQTHRAVLRTYLVALAASLIGLLLVSCAQTQSNAVLAHASGGALVGTGTGPMSMGFAPTASPVIQLERSQTSSFYGGR